MNEAVYNRIIDTKEREIEALSFLTKCGFFFKHDVYINEEPYVLDIYKRQNDNKDIEIAELKLGATQFCDIKTEEIKCQQEYYLLMHSQYLNYEKKFKKEKEDFLILMLHLYTPENCLYLNQRLQKLTSEYKWEHYLKEEISVLSVSFHQLCKLYHLNKCKIVQYSNQNIKDHHLRSSSDGKILKISSKDVGTYTNLNRQWQLLAPAKQEKILGHRLTQIMKRYQHCFN